MYTKQGYISDGIKASITISSYSFLGVDQVFWNYNLACLTLRLTLTCVVFCYGDWGIIIVSGFPDFSDSLVWVGVFMHADS